MDSMPVLDATSEVLESTETVEIFDESLFPGWTEEVIQTYLDQGWSIDQLKEWYDEHS